MPNAQVLDDPCVYCGNDIDQLKGTAAMTREYEIYSGRRFVKIQRSVNPLQAVRDYIHAFASESEVRIISVDSVDWRGARFKAVPVIADARAQPAA
jgi:hypothetical protein